MNYQVLIYISILLIIALIYYSIIIGERKSMSSYIKRYVRIGDKWTTEIIKGTYSDINYSKFSWKYIQEKEQSGWVEDKIPPEPPTPCIIASEGMSEIADIILSNKDKQT